MDERTRFERERSEFNESRVGRIFPSLRQGIWHATGPWAMRAIITAGEIRPNRRDLPFSHGQSANSYGFFKGYVCVFDFGVLQEREYVDFYSRWTGFFCSHEPFTVAIELERAALGERLVPSRAASAEFPRYNKVWIPRVEAWHKGAIDMRSAVLGCLVIPKDTGPAKRFDFDDPKFGRLLEVAAGKSGPPRHAAARPKFESRMQEWEVSPPD